MTDEFLFLHVPAFTGTDNAHLVPAANTYVQVFFHCISVFFFQLVVTNYTAKMSFFSSCSVTYILIGVAKVCTIVYEISSVKAK